MHHSFKNNLSLTVMALGQTVGMARLGDFLTTLQRGAGDKGDETIGETKNQWRRHSHIADFCALPPKSQSLSNESTLFRTSWNVRRVVV